MFHASIALISSFSNFFFFSIAADRETQFLNFDRKNQTQIEKPKMRGTIIFLATTPHRQFQPPNFHANLILLKSKSCKPQSPHLSANFIDGGPK